MARYWLVELVINLNCKRHFMAHYLKIFLILIEFLYFTLYEFFNVLLIIGYYLILIDSLHLFLSHIFYSVNCSNDKSDKDIKQYKFS